VLKRIFGREGDEVRGESKALHNKKLHGLYFSPNTRWFKYDRDDLCVNKSQFVPVIFELPCIIRAIKSRKMRPAEHVAYMGDKRVAYIDLWGGMKEKITWKT
jgi:hypothetical protein